METLHQVKTIIAAQCGLGTNEIGDHQPLSHREPDGLDLDSLDRIDLAVKLEEHFGIDIPDADIDRPELGCAHGLAAFIDQRLAEPETAPTITFRKKPVTIEAVRFLGIVDGQAQFAMPAHGLPMWLIEAMGEAEGHAGSVWIGRRQIDKESDEWLDGLFIGTLEGDHFATPGDWIIRGVQGELYPCKPDIFAATYEAVTSAPVANSVIADGRLALGPEQMAAE